MRRYSFYGVPCYLKPLRNAVFFLALFICADISAQNRPVAKHTDFSSNGEFYLKSFTTKNGLQQNQIYSAVEKMNGNVLVADFNGVLEFDGQEFRRLGKNVESKQTQYIKLFLSCHDSLVTASNIVGGFCRVFPSPGEVLYYDEKLYHPYYIGNDKFICFAVDGMLIEINPAHPKDARRICEKNFQPSEFVCNDKSIFVPTTKGLIVVDIKTGRDTMISNLFFKTLEKSPFTDDIYGRTYNEIYRITPKLEKLYDSKAEYPGDELYGFGFLDRSRLLVNVGGELFGFYNGKKINLVKDVELDNVSLRFCLNKSDSSCMLVGTLAQGLMVFKKTINRSLYKDRFKDAWNSVVRTPSGTIMAAKNCCAVFEFKGDSVVSEIDMPDATSCLAEISGTMAVGVPWKGVQFFDEKTKKFSDLIQIAPQIFVIAMHQDKAGNLWLATLHGVMVGKDINHLHPVFKDEIKSKTICFYENSKGGVWIGGNNGEVEVIDMKIVRKFVNKSGSMLGQVRSFYEDKQGKIWFGTYGDGLYCFKGNDLTRINSMKNCMLSNEVFTLARDKFGYLNSSSNHGLWKVKEKDLNDFFDKKIDRLIPFVYEDETGIFNTEFNGGFGNNYSTDLKGNLVFPTVDGLVFSKPSQHKNTAVNPIIARVYVNGNLVSDTNVNHTFDRQAALFRFDVASTNFFEINNLHYQHKLVSQKESSEWSAPQKNSIVYLDLLAPGNYTFYSRAVNAFNEREPEVAMYSFSIKPHFFETKWFFLLVTSFVMILLFFSGGLYFKQVRKKAMKEKAIQSRVAALELKILHSQMNPHFIYNSLNTIKYLVNVCKPSEADRYLDNFAFLIRSFLENSKEDFVTVEEKAHLLEAYLEFEKLRFKDRINFTMTIEDVVMNRFFPTFIVQPFVENAIKHGLGSVFRGGEINIEFKLVGQAVVCKIEDNGVGLGSKEDKGSSKHRSYGLKMVDEKLRLLKTKYDMEYSLTVTDKAKLGKTGLMIVIEIILHDKYRYN